MPLTSVLMVTKPVVPPFNDSSKNLVRDIVLGTDRVHFTVLTAGAYSFDRPHIRERAVYQSAGGLAPSVAQNARVLLTLARRGLADIHHYFFAPNPRTGQVIRTLRLLNHPPAIHTICSVPRDFTSIRRHLFADIHVALSRYTQHRLEEAGVADVWHIPPCIPPLVPCFDESEQQRLRRSFGLAEDRPVVLYPGDYDYSRTAFNVASAALRLDRREHPVTWVFACRLKQPASIRLEREIQGRLATLHRSGRAVFFRHVDRMAELITASDLVVLPAETTFAKMDLPLVLIEAMALGRPVIIADLPPVNELPVPQGGWTVTPGDPSELANVVSEALDSPAERLRRGHQGALLVSERYDRARVAAQYADLYERCR